MSPCPTRGSPSVIIRAPRHASRHLKPALIAEIRKLAKKKKIKVDGLDVRNPVIDPTHLLGIGCDNASEWNSLLITARAERGPQWDVATQRLVLSNKLFFKVDANLVFRFMVDCGSTLYFDPSPLLGQQESEPHDETNGGSPRVDGTQNVGMDHHHRTGSIEPRIHSNQYHGSSSSTASTPTRSSLRLQQHHQQQQQHHHHQQQQHQHQQQHQQHQQQLQLQLQQPHQQQHQQMLHLQQQQQLQAQAQAQVHMNGHPNVGGGGGGGSSINGVQMGNPYPFTNGSTGIPNVGTGGGVAIRPGPAPGMTPGDYTAHISQLQQQQHGGAHHQQAISSPHPHVQGGGHGGSQGGHPGFGGFDGHGSPAPQTPHNNGMGMIGMGGGMSNMGMGINNINMGGMSNSPMIGGGTPGARQMAGMVHPGTISMGGEFGPGTPQPVHGQHPGMQYGFNPETPTPNLRRARSQQESGLEMNW